MGLNKITLRMTALMIATGIAGSGCSVMQGLMSPKDLAGVGNKKEIAQSSNSTVPDIAKPEVVFKEVPYGASTGTVVVPSFQNATTQVLDLLGLPLARAANVRTVSTTVGGNLPEIGVVSNVSIQTIFSYSKLYIAACTDKCDLDRGANAPAAAERLCTFDTGRPHNDAANAAAWDSALMKMGELFWGRSELTADEKAALITLRDEVGAVAVERNNGNRNAGSLPAFQAVCATMAMAPASLAQ